MIPDNNSDNTIMTFELAPAVLSDIPETVDIAIAAFETDPIFGQMKLNCSLADVRTCDIKLYERGFQEPGVRFFKIVDNNTGSATCSITFGSTF